jgi:cytochrome bd-type quinol oxidase subunit 2
MLLRLLKLALREPSLLSEHASAYAQLLKQDAARWQSRQLARAVYLAAAAAGLAIGATFAGVALMLYAVTDSDHWLLWIVPAVPLVGAVAALLLARAAPPPMFARVQQQFAEDAQVFGKEPER